MRRSVISVKNVKWLMPLARASMWRGDMRSRRAMRTTPIGISWHMPTLRSDVARLMASVTRLIGFDRLTRKASGAYRSMSAQMDKVLAMLRSEWNTAPGPPFSPLTWVAPYRRGIS
ncbi:MAG: hypothetical protein R2699_16700 [Acidimicrobiales bacterium]